MRPQVHLSQIVAEHAVIEAAETWVEALGKPDVIAAGLLLNTAVADLRKSRKWVPMHAREAQEEAGKVLASLRDNASKGTLCLFPFEGLHDEIAKSIWATHEIVELRKRVEELEEELSGYCECWFKDEPKCPLHRPGGPLETK